MKHFWKIAFTCVYVILFTALIYLAKEIFFPSKSYEERYIEPNNEYSVFSHSGSHAESHSQSGAEDFSSFSGVTRKQVDAAVHELIYKEFSKKHDVLNREKVQIRAIPQSLKNIIEYSYLPLAETFLYKKWILSHVDSMKVLLYKNKFSTRGKMKNGNIHMYGIEKLSDEEFLSVLVHEFAHYYDIYSLPGNAFWDRSHDFYKISWKENNIVRPGQEMKDFVSGYALTNKYEDFAESYTYFLLHNAAFVKRAEQSEVLLKKYNFFESYAFPARTFEWTSFSIHKKIEDYYWDITKIPVDVKKFLQYFHEPL